MDEAEASPMKEKAQGYHVENKQHKTHLQLLPHPQRPVRVTLTAQITRVGGDEWGAIC